MLNAKGRQLRAAMGVLACALPVLLYQRTLDNPFVFDDRTTVLLNPSLIDAWNLRAALLHNLARPVVNLSYAIDRGFWGFSPFGFHITNGILHLIVVGLLYGWCTRALADGVTRSPRTATAGQGPEWAAFFAATAFALHPLMSSTVLYVSARSELLCAAGFLTTLIFARRAILNASRTSGVLAAGCGLLALLSGPGAAALPLLVLAYDAWVLRDGGWIRRARRVYLPGLLAVAVAGASRLPAVLDAVRIPPRGVFVNLLTEGLVIW